MTIDEQTTENKKWFDRGRLAALGELVKNAPMERTVENDDLFAGGIVFGFNACRSEFLKLIEDLKKKV